MNQAHYHLLVNHLPILGTLFGMLTLAAGFIIKNSTVKRTGLGILIFAAISVFAANITGEGAEEIVEPIAGIEKSYIHEHEEAAETLIGIMIALGVISIFTLVVDVLQRKYAPILYILTLVFSIITMFFAQKTGTTGGEIRHTEIRADAPAQGTEIPASNTEEDNH
jgi:uncharacterized membrane protein